MSAIAGRGRSPQQELSEQQLIKYNHKSRQMGLSHGKKQLYKFNQLDGSILMANNIPIFIN